MARPSKYKALILKDLADGIDPMVVGKKYPVTQSYVYKLGKQQREANKPRRITLAEANVHTAKHPETLAHTDTTVDVGAPSRVPRGDLFTQKSISSLIRHGGDVYEDYLREFQGNRSVAIYKEMGNDPICAAVLSAIRMTLRRVRWYATAPTDKQNEAKDFLDESMDDMSNSWSDFIDQALSMLQYGFAPMEVVYKLRKGDGRNRPGPHTARSRYDDGRIGWKKFALIGQDTLASGQMWEFDEGDGSLRGLNQNPPAGSYSVGKGFITQFIPIEKMVLFRTTTEKDNPEGRSIFRAMYGSFWYSKNMTEIEAISAERLGAGFPVVYLGDDVTKGTNEDSDILEFQKIMRNIRVDEQMSLVIPFAKMGQGMARESSGVLFELVSPPARGNIDFNTIIQRHEKRMAMVGLAQFIHLGMDQQGSQALAAVTTDFFQLAVSAWADSLKDTINRFGVDPLFALNSSLGKEDHPIIDHSDISTPDLKVVADYINKTVGAMVITPDDKLEESLRRIAGLPDKDEATTRSVMTEQDGDGGERISRKEGAKPANNQRNRNPVADKPTPAAKPQARKPMAASDNIIDLEQLEEELKTSDMFAIMDMVEKFEARRESTRQHEDNKQLKMLDQTIELMKAMLTMRQEQTAVLASPQYSSAPITISGDVGAETLAEAIRIIRGGDNTEADKFDAIVKAIRETPVQLQLPEGMTPDYNKFATTIADAAATIAARPEPKSPTVIVTTPTPKVEVLPGQINVTNEVHLPHERTTTKKIERDSMGRMNEVIEHTKYDSSEND